MVSTNRRRCGVMGLVLGLCAGAAVWRSPSPAYGDVAEERLPPAPEETGVNHGAISLTVGVDWVSEYYDSRGFPQQDNGIVLQPYFDIAARLWQASDDNSPLNDVTINFGSWHSTADNHVPEGTKNPGEGVTWHEADLYAGVTVTVLRHVSLGVTYVFYEYPDDALERYQEVLIELGLDDSDWLGPWALHPTVTFAQEITRSAPDVDRRQYVELGLCPGVVILPSEDYPVTLTVPVTVGLSLDGVYLSNAAAISPELGHNRTFGAATVGLMFSVPLAFIPADFGAWTFTAGPTFIFVNNDVADFVNKGSNFEALAKAGVVMEY